MIDIALGACRDDGAPRANIANGSEGEDSVDQAMEAPASALKLVNPALGGPGALTPYCVARVSSNEVSCHSTFREAIAFATGGMIVDAPEAKVALADESFARRINALSGMPNITSIMIGINFVNINFQGHNHRNRRARRPTQRSTR